MTRRLIVLLVLVAASAAVLVTPAAATTPPPPPGPPSAYVQTANYNSGCSDWYLRSISQVVSNLNWVSDCSNTYGDEWYSWVQIDSYYWNAGQQRAILFEQQVWDSDGWFSVCYVGGACQA
jgi:hypothetical protein